MTSEYTELIGRGAGKQADFGADNRWDEGLSVHCHLLCGRWPFLRGTVEVGYSARYLKEIYLRTLPEFFTGAERLTTGIACRMRATRLSSRCGLSKTWCTPATTAFPGMLSSGWPVTRMIGAVTSRLCKMFARSMPFKFGIL